MKNLTIYYPYGTQPVLIPVDGKDMNTFLELQYQQKIEELIENVTILNEGGFYDRI